MTRSQFSSTSLREYSDATPTELPSAQPTPAGNTSQRSIQTLPRVKKSHDTRAHDSSPLLLSVAPVAMARNIAPRRQSIYEDAWDARVAPAKALQAQRVGLVLVVCSTTKPSTGNPFPRPAAPTSSQPALPQAAVPRIKITEQHTAASQSFCPSSLKIRHQEKTQRTSSGNRFVNTSCKSVGTSAAVGPEGPPRSAPGVRGGQYLYLYA
jgi:hypothetical protein